MISFGDRRIHTSAIVTSEGVRPSAVASEGFSEFRFSAFPGMRVLVVEDEPELLRVVGQALREEGYAVDGAADGREGLFRRRAGTTTPSCST